MGFLTIVVLLLLFYFLLCVSIVLLADSDILTFLAAKFGKNPRNVYAGKVIWITGASSGIGEAIAKELAKHGAKLVLSARRIDDLNRVKQQCLAINPALADGDILVLPFDMCDLPAHQPSFDAVMDRFGAVDVLVSNAGRSQRAYLQDIDLAVDKELFDLNVFSLVHLNRIVLKYFLSVGKGQIAVNSSLSGIIGSPYSASYTGSKHAIQGYFKSLRNEVGNDIPVTILLPGPTFSGFLSEAFTAEAGKKFGKEIRSTDRRMTAERCAYLSVLAMANNIEEAWIGLFPFVGIAYLNSYAPYIYSKVELYMRKHGSFMKMRDSRDTMQEN